MNNLVKKVVIVGGGTAGWMTAAYLIKFLAKSDVSITVVESSDIGSVGVGEATIPTIREFYGALGMKDQDVMKATNATFKLGIEFQNWFKPNHSFFHPFAQYGQSVNGVNFHHYWNKMRQHGYEGELSEFSLGVMLAKNGKFTFPAKNPPSPMSVFDWALHFDAGLFAKMLKEYSLERGVTLIDDKITNVNLRENDGFIDTLELENEGVVSGELFIDCSGFQALLIEGALKTGYEDWSEWLLCDRAVAVQSESASEPLPYTISAAEGAGWRWQIPLQHRDGNGHVYSSTHMSDDEATQILLDNVKGSPISEPKSFKFTPGRRVQAWNKNCIAVGLSSGFLEPLESTSIALIELAIQKIRLFFPDQTFDKDVIAEFNDRTKMEYERVRDFVIYHYKANRRGDTDFWRHCESMDIPETLAYKNRLFEKRGHLVKSPYEIFQLPSWLAIYTGNNVQPTGYDTMVDSFGIDYLKNVFDQMRKSVADSVAQAPTHAEFLTKI
ncbi:tryptophan halogenase family protein [Teredinibacter waterburyi]|uniref:tryptophan halogenase family protein n=1 Tax=Teredinibacter waterburyi TaxID=1500538 RepID=UPI00165F2BC5|nr:tryptophan halogenase family protein [Teredinibacter waterburyi]